MKTLLLIVTTLSFSLVYAQPGGGGMQGGGMRGGGQRGGGTQQQREIPEFNAEKTVGIFNYDTDEVIKKLKIKKKEKDLKLDIRRAVANYNNNINEIALLNKDNFDTLNVFMNTIIKSNMSNRQSNRGGQGHMRGSRMERGENSGSDNDDPISKARKLAREKTQPARKAVREEESKLNSKFEALLNEKKYNKWLKYQEDVKEDLNPKPQSNNQNRGQMSGGMGRGQGGQRGGGMR